MRQDPSTSPTNASSVKWRVTFSEVVANVDAGDFSVGGVTGVTLTVAAVTGSSSQYDVTAAGGGLASLDGTVTLAFSGTQDIADNADNALSNTTPTSTNDNEYVLDNTAPTVASIVRQDPSTSPTNANSVKWRVTFSEAVANVDAADFAISGTTATLTVAAVSGSTSRYDVTASGGNLAGLDATVTLAFSGTQNIADNANNTLSNTTPTGTDDNEYVVDNTAPTVAITGVPATSGAAFTATFTFSEGVTGFALADIAEGNATASQFTGSDGDTAYTALITPASDGTVTVDVAAGVAADAAGNDNAAAPQATSTYSALVVDTTAPRVASIVRQDPSTSPTNASSVKWRVTFSEAVANVDAGDFAVSGVTGVTLTVAAVTGSSSQYDVTAAGGGLASLDGTVTLAFSGTQDIADNADNALSNTTPTSTNDNAYVLDNTAPRVASIVRQDPSTSPTNASSVKWRVTFSEAVANVDAGDFAVSGVTGVTLTVAAVTGSSSQYDVTATGGGLASLDGTVTLAFSGGQDIADNADNTLSNTTPTGTDDNEYVVDNTAPTVASIVRQDPSTSPTNADSLKWRVTFSEAVANVNAGDFAISGTTATLTVAAVSGSTSRYDVTASGGNLAGLDATVTLAFSGTQNIADNANNTLSNTTPTGTDDNEYVVDNTAPTVAITGVPATSGAAFTATFTFSEGVTGFALADIAEGNATASQFTGSDGDTAYTALITPASDGTVTVDVAAGVAADAAGNDNAAAPQATSTYSAQVVDTTAPRVTSIVRQDPSTSPTNADSLKWRVTFSEAVANVDAADFAVSGTPGSR